MVMVMDTLVSCQDTYFRTKILTPSIAKRVGPWWLH